MSTPAANTEGLDRHYDPELDRRRVLEEIDHMRAEQKRWLAEKEHQIVEQQKLQAEREKLRVEREKLSREAWWHPLWVGAAVFAAGAAFVKLFMTP